MDKKPNVAVQNKLKQILWKQVGGLHTIRMCLQLFLNVDSKLIVSCHNSYDNNNSFCKQIRQFHQRFDIISAKLYFV